jgi:hypothetical protein
LPEIFCEMHRAQRRARAGAKGRSVRWSWWLFAVVLGGCGGEEPLPPGQLVLTVGHELDAWSREPVPSIVEIDRLLETGDRQRLETVSPPVDRISLGQGTVASYELNARDVDGSSRLFARSLPIEPDGFAGFTLPLFVSRTREFARPPSVLPAPPGAGAPAAIAGGRFLVLAGTYDDGSIQVWGYDLGFWDPLDVGVRLRCPTESCRFRSFAVVDDTLALGVSEESAIWFDLATYTSGDAPVPTGLASYADVSGGNVVAAPDGSMYLVGATREQPPTRSVLRVHADGKLEALDLGFARAGASATWLEPHGLVVVGGSASGAGAEFLADGASGFVQVPYPPDDSVGAALVPLDDTNVLRVGGRIGAVAAPSVVLTHTCTADCTLTPRGSPVELDRASGFALPDQRALIVGTGPDGQTLVVGLDADGTPTPVPLREPRSGASAIRLPTTHIAVAGGTLLDGTRAASIELFAP